MDKIFKILRKRRKNERFILIATIQFIENGKLDDLDIIKLSGHKNLYRVRVGKFRIIYRNENQMNKVIMIDERNDKTYKNF